MLRNPKRACRFDPIRMPSSQPTALGLALFPKTDGTNCVQARLPSNPFEKRHAMRYRVYSGPRGAAEISLSDKERMLFKEFESLDAALGWAGHLTASGRVPLLIEGDDGTRLDKRAIATAQTVAAALTRTMRGQPRPSSR